MVRPTVKHFRVCSLSLGLTTWDKLDEYTAKLQQLLFRLRRMKISRSDIADIAILIGLQILEETDLDEVAEIIKTPQQNHWAIQQARKRRKAETIGGISDEELENLLT